MRLTALILVLLAYGASSAGCQSSSQRSRTVVLAAPSFIAVRVADVERSSAWYRRVFRLSEANRIESDDGRYSIRILSDGALTVELIQERGLERPSGRYLGHFKAGLYVTDIAAFHDHLEELGVDVDAETFVDEALSVRSFVFSDNEGNRLQAFERCAGSC